MNPPEQCTLREAADVAAAGALRWERAKGCRVQHAQHDHGEVTIAGYNKLSQTRYALVRWEQTGRHARFDGEQLSELVLLDPSLAADVQTHARARQAQLEQLRAKEAQRLKEAQDRVRFDTLKTKYEVEQFADRAPTSSLFPILLQLDDGEALDQQQLSWLRREGLDLLLARYFQERYRGSREPWDLVRASSAWRDAGRPETARELMDWLLTRTATGGGRLHSAVLTSRGGAYRDLGDLSAAERDAQQAIRCAPDSFYPYNLLGAICFQRGQAAEGEDYFLKAEALGASRQADDEMQRALRSSDDAERRAVAAYLLHKDPRRYAWAFHYRA